MPETTWTAQSESTTAWAVDTSVLIGGWGDSWGLMGWGEGVGTYSDFTLAVEPGSSTAWVKQ